MPAKVAVKARVSTRAKIVVAVAAIFALGLAAYGFGFLPISFQGAEETPAACQEQCRAEYAQCQKEAQDDPKCDDDYKTCETQCPKEEPAKEEPKAEEPKQEEQPKVEEPGAPSCERQCEQIYCSATPAAYVCDDEALAACQDGCRVTTTEGSPAVGPITSSPTTCTMMAVQERGSGSEILVGGADAWQSFDQYRITADDDDVTIDRIVVTTTGDAANFERVGIAKDGRLLGQNIVAAGRSNAEIAIEPITLRRGESAVLNVWGKMSATVSSAAVGGATSGVARSGNPVALGLAAAITTGEWDESYRDHYNIRATCASSGGRAYARHPGSSTYGPIEFLRKTKIVFTRQPPASHTLVNADMDLFRFQLSTDIHGSAAWKKVSLTYQISRSAPGALALSDFRLRRGSTEMARGDYQIIDQDGNDIEGGIMPTSTDRGIIVIALTNEHTISGSGYVYTLHARASGANAGDEVVLRTPSEALSADATGYLTAAGTASALEGEPGPNLDLSEPADGRPDRLPSFFIWSDLSEVPHSSAVGTAGGSRDWIPGTLVVPEYEERFTR